MNHRELSEVCYGLVQEGRHPVTLYRPEMFAAPYDEAIRVLSQKNSSKEDVAKVINSSYMTDAADAVHRFNGIGEYQNFDWAKALQVAYINAERGRKFEKVAKKMKENDEVDLLQLYGELSAAISQETTGLRLASQINYGEYKPFRKCGYEPIDMTLGGLPTDGPIIVYGLTGVGKSKFGTALINGLLHQYPNETAAVYTLEMPDDHWMWRSVQLFPSLKQVMDRLFVSSAVRNVEELVAEITAKKVNYVLIDDMDNLVNSSDASEYERVYRRIKEICRFMKIPVIVLCQPNRIAKMSIQNGERFLGQFDVAWSGAAENSAALQIALQTANGLDMKSEEFPTTDDPMDYIIFWKSRDGWPADRDPKAQRGPGAVVMSHSPNWMGKPYGGKWRIHSPMSGSRVIGAKKKKRSAE